MKPGLVYRCRTAHGAYGFILIAGVRHAQCAECGHTWTIHLRLDGDTDGLSPDMPGIALR